jgi:hypothetical protein
MKNAAAVVLALLVIGGGFWIWRNEKGGKSNEYGIENKEKEVTQMPVPPLTKQYKNTKYGFSFSYPESYRVREAATENGDGVYVEPVDASTGSQAGIQILISPYADADTDITAEKIHADISDLKVDSPQEVDVGAGGSVSKGVAFKSDNGAFDGDSREVWFAYKDNLYQISTYAADDDFLRAVFGTWLFGK